MANSFFPLNVRGTVPTGVEEVIVFDERPRKVDVAPEPGKSKRVFPRTIRAGNLQIDVWVLIVRRTS